jgi:hypothetical protein
MLKRVVVRSILFVAALAASSTLAFLLHIGVIYTPWETGYWGKYNQVRRVITNHGLQITDSWEHQDITLEDFGFTVCDDHGRQWKIDFFETSPQMKLTTDEEILGYVRACSASLDI